MGGALSLLNCEKDYPVTGGTGTSTVAKSEDSTNNLAIAAFLFVGTILVLFILTLVVHCLLIHNRRRKSPPPDVDESYGYTVPLEVMAAGHRLSVANNAPNLQHFDAVVRPDSVYEGDEEGYSSDESSDTSLDSVTARAAANVAANRAAAAANARAKVVSAKSSTHHQYDNPGFV